MHTNPSAYTQKESECVCVGSNVYARHVGPTPQLIHSRFEDGQRAINVCRLSQCEGDVTISTAS